MSPTLKKALLSLLLLVVAILIGFGLYYAFNKIRTTGGPTTTPNNTGSGGTLPGSGTRTSTTGGTGSGGTTGPGRLPGSQTNVLPEQGTYKPDVVTKITDDSASYSSLGTNGQFRYQSTSDGKFYRLNTDGSVTALSDQVFYNVNKVTWAPNKNTAVLEYPDSSKIIYNFDTQKQVSVPKHWQEFSFAPDGAQIAAKSIGLSPENRFLITVNDDGTGTRLIEPMGENGSKVTVAWSPSRQTVALSQTGEPLGLDRREVLFVGLNGENFKSTVVEGLDFMPAWSPTGKQLLYSIDSARQGFRPELWVVDAYGETIGGNRRSLQINTWANKCTFADDNTLYCAVPRSLPEGAGMAPEIAAGIPDDVYKIDLKTGVRSSIPVDKEYQITNLSYNTKDNALYFTDANQNGIFKINP